MGARVLPQARLQPELRAAQGAAWPVPVVKALRVADSRDAVQVAPLVCPLPAQRVTTTQVSLVAVPQVLQVALRVLQPEPAALRQVRAVRAVQARVLEVRAPVAAAEALAAAAAEVSAGAAVSRGAVGAVSDRS